MEDGRLAYVMHLHSFGAAGDSIRYQRRYTGLYVRAHPYLYIRCLAAAPCLIGGNYNYMLSISKVLGWLIYNSWSCHAQIYGAERNFQHWANAADCVQHGEPVNECTPFMAQGVASTLASWVCLC